MKWASVTNWHIHFDTLFTLIWPLSYGVGVDIFAKNVNLDNGLKIQAEPHTGTPIVNFFNTYLDLGQSYIQLSGDFVIAIIGWFANLFKDPLQVIINEFLQPIINWVINGIIIPDVLHNGLIEVPITATNGQPFDTLVIDATLPQQPAFSTEKMDLFFDGAVYFKNHGKHFAGPSKSTGFKLDEQNLQIDVTSFAVNDVIEAVMSTQLIQLPIDHHLI